MLIIIIIIVLIGMDEIAHFFFCHWPHAKNDICEHACFITFRIWQFAWNCIITDKPKNIENSFLFSILRWNIHYIEQIYHCQGKNKNNLYESCHFHYHLLIWYSAQMPTLCVLVVGILLEISL